MQKMKSIRIINILFVIFLFVTLSNIDSAFAIIFNKSRFGWAVNYLNYVLLIFAFLISLTNNGNGNTTHLYSLKLFNRAKWFPIFLIAFYLGGLFSSSLTGDYKSFLNVFPQMIRCGISSFIFTWLLCYLFAKKQQEFYLKKIMYILIASIFSIIILNYLKIDLSLLLKETNLQNGFKIGRSSGFFLNPNIAAQNVILTIIFLLFFFLKKPSFNKIFLFSALCICIYSLFLTYSNTGYLNAVVIIFLFFLIRSKSKFIFSFFFIVVLIFIEFFFLPYLSSEINSYYVENNIPLIQQKKTENFINILMFSPTNKIDVSLRGKIDEIGIAKIEERPIFGYGAGSFQANIYQGYGIHNSFLQVLGESGFLFFILYSVYFLKLILRCLTVKDRRFRFLLLSSVSSLVIYQLTTHGILYNEDMLFVIIFLNVLTFKFNDDRMLSKNSG